MVAHSLTISSIMFKLKSEIIFVMNLQSQKYSLDITYNSEYLKTNDFSLFCLFHRGCHVGMKIRFMSLVLVSTWQPSCNSLEVTNDNFCGNFLIICGK